MLIYGWGGCFEVIFGILGFCLIFFLLVVLYFSCSWDEFLLWYGMMWGYLLLWIGRDVYFGGCFWYLFNFKMWLINSEWSVFCVGSCWKRLIWLINCLLLILFVLCCMDGNGVFCYMFVGLIWWVFFFIIMVIECNISEFCCLVKWCCFLLSW